MLDPLIEVVGISSVKFTLFPFVVSILGGDT